MCVSDQLLMRPDATNSLRHSINQLLEMSQAPQQLLVTLCSKI
jgi:hypothetical protein